MQMIRHWYSYFFIIKYKGTSTVGYFMGLGLVELPEQRLSENEGKAWHGRVHSNATGHETWMKNGAVTYSC